MGAWGVGHFENDDALDWVGEVEDGDILEMVDEAIAGAESGGDYLEAPDGCWVLAAAEIIAAMLGHASTDLPEPLPTMIAQLPAGADPELVERTRAAVDRVLAEDSELRELWAETDDFDAWTSAVAELKTRLVA